MTDKYELDTKSYSKMKTWGEKFSDGNVSLSEQKISQSWKPIFDKLLNDKRFKQRTEKTLSDDLTENKNLMINPLPDLVFNAFVLTSLKKLKVVFIGQDPYFDHEVYENKKNKTNINVPQAMGLSFSVPHGIKVPSSLNNIYRNLEKNKHINQIPKHGNLESWAEQGCLMLNSALTVKDGKDNKNCHQYAWEWFTNEIISYISENKDHVIFVLWGAYAYKKESIIDQTKHKLIVSSHPSGLSAGKPMGKYPAFNNEDHFGKINEQLKEWNMEEIDWDNSD
jgi:uracil-DNA glycosylase